MELIITILVAIIVALTFSCYNLYKKVIFFEDKIIEIQDTVQNTINIMRSIDLRGAFESDDEVGDVFSQMKRLIENLGQYIYEEEKER